MQVAIVSAAEEGARAAAEGRRIDGLANGGAPRLRSSFGRREEEDGRSTASSTSTIGAAPGEGSASSSPDSSSASDGEDDDEEVQRKRPGAGGPSFGSLQALEDSLPIKRGLSSYFNGKSKSFACLTDISSSSSSAAEEIAKPENPFNKRRRILMASCKSSCARHASCGSLAAAALPHLSLRISPWRRKGTTAPTRRPAHSGNRLRRRRCSTNRRRSSSS